MGQGENTEESKSLPLVEDMTGNTNKEDPQAGPGEKEKNQNPKLC